jgi:hypothetical protein
MNKHLLLSVVALMSIGTAAMSSAAWAQTAADRPGVTVLDAAAGDARSVTLVGRQGRARIAVDAAEDAVVTLAAKLLADDVERVTGKRPEVTGQTAGAGHLIVAGTLGKSALIQKLADGGKLKGLDRLKGKWEGTLTEVVDNPFPGIERALVIAGSDRRGTAYGLMELSRQIGVSPWYWWADVPVTHHDTLSVGVAQPAVDTPAVKYRGLFINDEDWGLFPWAAKTFDPAFGNIGPKTYERVFELMLRLRLNYIWPAMHACSIEFGSVPENYKLADKYGIVAGSSHCEPMLCNNIHWDEREKGRWNFSLNRDTIHKYWDDNVKARAGGEAVWTLGIRGIHDQGMQTPPNDTPGKINLMTEVFRDQRDLLDQNVTKQWGPVAQCFVPYKEVLPIYDAGLKVPDDVTLVWVDDNFGYIRRLSSPAERSRSGGAGVYWHLSYYGGPHSYTWLNTTAPALMWEELHKAWENDARQLWMLNVGDIKPMEIGIDYFAQLAWNPEGRAEPAQRDFLRQFAARNFGAKLAEPVADLLMEYYRLGTIRKPELMERNWAISLSDERARELDGAYQRMLEQSRKLAPEVPAPARDAYTELVDFPVHVLAASGQIFMADRGFQKNQDVAANQEKIRRLRDDLNARVADFNTKVAGGKWNLMMPGVETARDLMAWNSQVRWPWGERNARVANPDQIGRTPMAESTWRNASSANRRTAAGRAQWKTIPGLGTSGESVALLPAGLDSAWKEGDPAAPALVYDFTGKAGDADAWIDFLPAFRLYPGMKLRVTVSVDDGRPAVVEVPGSSGDENENGQIRSRGVQDNYVRARAPLPGLTAGKHTFTIRAVDPGVVVDRVSLP